MASVVQRGRLHAGTTTACDSASGFAVVAPPSVSASFQPGTIDEGFKSALKFTITNPDANTVPLSGVTLSTTLPAGLTVASPNGVAGSCGTITASPGSQSIVLTGGSVPTGDHCAFSIDVTAPTAGQRSVTTGVVQSANGGAGNTATATLTARLIPSIAITAPASAPLGTPTHATAIRCAAGTRDRRVTFTVFHGGRELCSDPLVAIDVDVDGAGNTRDPTSRPLTRAPTSGS